MIILFSWKTMPHRTKAVGELESEGIHHLDKPALSPYINPLKHAWDKLPLTVSA